MSSVGLSSFDIMRGLPANLKTRVDMWEIPGIDGVGAQTLGLGDGRFQLTTVVYTVGNAEANTLIAACEAMQGTVQTLIDDWGDEYDGILIERVDTTDAKKPCIRNGNAAAVRVSINWQMCSTVVQA